MATVRQALLRAAITGKKVSPKQLIQSAYGPLGAPMGRLQGLSGIVSSMTPKPPNAPAFPKAHSLLKGLV